MKRTNGTRSLAALAVSVVALVLAAAGTSGATTTRAHVTSTARGTVSVSSAVTRTFSFIGRANSKAMTLLNIDGLLINARCSGNGSPIVFAFSSASSADLFGRLFDGLGRIHIVKNSAFTKKSRGVELSTSSGDFDSTGTVLFEQSNGKVVTVNYAFDNATTLNKTNVCTVYGSYIAS
jgi:hypothetical protein